MNDKINLDPYSKDYPEHKLTNRVKLSYNWIDDKVDYLLDGGCSYGYGTRFLNEKSNNTFAIDINQKHVEVATFRYPDIDFKNCTLEATGFQDNQFDFIVLNDVLEHTNDKIQTLREMYRILKINGKIIISTPHKGLFAFLDPYNHGYNLQKNFPKLYKGLYKLIRLLKDGAVPTEYNPEHLHKHWHYSINELIGMLNSTEFKDNYEIERTFRSGLFLEVIAMNLEALLNIIFKQRISQKILKPLYFLADLDYFISYGPLAYNIALKIKKTG